MSQVGTILCAKCARKREYKSYACPHCQAIPCMISLYWRMKDDEEGQNYQYRHNGTKLPMGWYEADRFLTVLRAKIDDDRRGLATFNPKEYLQSHIAVQSFVIQVDNWLKELKERVGKKELAQGSYDTYDTYRRIWCAEYKYEEIDPKTNRIITRRFSLKEKSVELISAKTLKKFKDVLPNTMTISYKRHIMNGMRTFFRWMHREEIIKSVPPFPIISGAAPKKRKAITQEAQGFYLDKIPSKHRDVIEFAFCTGIRESEDAAVKVKDIDTETWVFTVRHNYTSGNILTEITKGKHDDDIPLSPRAIEVAKRNMKDKHPESFLFINPNTGRGYLPATIYKIWLATEAAVNFHEAARHSFATQLAKIPGVTPQQIQRLCRQRDIRTTMQYVHMDLTDLRDLVNQREQGEVVSLDSVREAKKANENKV